MHHHHPGPGPSTGQSEDDRERKHYSSRPRRAPSSTRSRAPDRILGRSQADLADAMTWLAWYAPGTFTAVLDYMDTVDGEVIPAH